MSKKLISIVIPAYNEEKNISLMVSELQQVLRTIKDIYDYEIIFVDDGSSDNTFEEILKFGKNNKKIKGIKFSKNYGKEIAITAGIDSSSGDAIITIDCDGQHPVEQIPNFINEWEKGFDIVYNKRPNIKGASFFKKLSSKLFYFIFNLISDFKLEPSTTDYRLLDRKVVNYYIQFKEKNRLYRGLTDWIGFSKKELVFDANIRFDGKKVGSYSFLALYKLAINAITSFSVFPLKFISYLGLFITVVSTFLLIFILFNKFVYNFFNFSNLVIVVVLNTILIGIVLVSLGIISLYVARIHEEVLGRPMYTIKDKTNFKDNK